MPSPDRRLQDRTVPFVAALLVALVVHVVGYVGADAWLPSVWSGTASKLRLAGISSSSGKPSSRIQIDVRHVDESAQRKTPLTEDDRVPGQVVSVPPPLREERPDAARYAADHDEKADRDTKSRDPQNLDAAVARKSSPGRPGALAQGISKQAELKLSQAPAATSSGPSGPGRAIEGTSGTDTNTGGGEKLFALSVPKQDAQQQLKLRLDPLGNFRNQDAHALLPGRGNEARIALGQKPGTGTERSGEGNGDGDGQGLRGGGNGTQGLPTLAELVPSQESLLRIAGAPSADYLPDAELDAETRLNAWRFKHAPFFKRIADSVRRTWQGGTVLRNNDPRGDVYGFSDRYTILQVSIDKNGNIVEAAVAEESGALVLDEEALRALREAGPFINPPSALFAGKDHFTFRFGFNISYGKANFDFDWRPH